VSSSSTNQAASATPAPPCVAPLAASDPNQWFAQEVHPHGPQLKAYLQGSFPDLRHEAEDVVQESFLWIWKEKTTKQIRSVRGLLYTVAKHIALNTLRHQRRSPITAVSSLEALGALEDKPDAAEALSYQDKVEVLIDIISALPERRRVILTLCKFRKLSSREVAEQLGLDLRTVENHLYRAVRQCREKLQAKGIYSLQGDENR